VGYSPERIVEAALEAQPGSQSAYPYGDGRSGERIIACLTGVKNE